MKRGERIPLHDHSDRNAGGPVAPFTVQQATGSSTTGGSTGGGGSHADVDHTSFMYDPADGREDVSALGTVGATTTVDPTLGNVVSMTLSANCTATISALVGSGASTLELWVTQDGTGGWALTVAATGGTVTGDISAHTTTAGETFRVIAERIPGTSNDWVVDLVGGGGSALTIEDEGTPLATAADTLDFVGAGVTASGTGAEKTITIPGVTAAAVAALGFVGALVITDTPSTPLVFADLVQNEDQDDLVYADIP
jgi:hypothetical protein